MLYRRRLIRLAQKVTFMYMNVNAKMSFLVKESKNLPAELEMISQSLSHITISIVALALTLVTQRGKLVAALKSSLTSSETVHS